MVEVAEQLVECAVFSSRFEVRSVDGDALGDATVHCSGAFANGGEWHRVEAASARGRSCTRAAHIGELYDGFDAVGLQYGPRYRTLVCAWGGSTEAMAQLRARATQEGTQVHPADLDDALCTRSVIRSGGGDSDGETRLPFALDNALLQGGKGILWAVRRSVQTRRRLAF